MHGIWTFSDAISEAWGLHVNVDLSFFRTVVYYVIILLGPVAFWGWWLHQWPTDWQNATVPMMVSLALLSSFWLVIWEAGKAKRERERWNRKTILNLYSHLLYEWEMWGFKSLSYLYDLGC